MSVDLSVGMLDAMRQFDKEGFEHYRTVFRRITELLKQKGLPAYEEPEDLGGRGWYTRLSPPNGLAYLQRLAVYLWWKMDEGLPDPGTYEMDNPLHDPAIEFAYEDSYFEPEHRNAKGQNFAHLVCHSPRSGFWLPVDFAKVLVDGRTEYGSSHRLKEACEAVAEAIGLPLEIDAFAPEVQSALEAPGDGEGWRRYGIEAFNCLLMHRAARLSIELGAAIVLH